MLLVSVSAFYVGAVYIYVFFPIIVLIRAVFSRVWRQGKSFKVICNLNRVDFLNVF